MQPSYEEKKEKFSIIRKKPHHVPPHLHNAIELVYVTKGELELGVGCEPVSYTHLRVLSLKPNKELCR